MRLGPNFKISFLQDFLEFCTALGELDNELAADECRSKFGFETKDGGWTASQLIWFTKMHNLNKQIIWERKNVAIQSMVFLHKFDQKIEWDLTSQAGEEAFKDAPLSLLLQIRRHSTELSTNGISWSTHILQMPQFKRHVKIPTFQREALRERFEAEQEGKVLKFS